MNMKNVELNIGGMTCINCQNKIEKELRHLRGVTFAKVSYSTGIAKIKYNADIISIKQICDAIEKIGYEVKSSNSISKEEIYIASKIISIILLAYVVVSHTGILNYLAPTELAESGMSYGVLFIVGLLTSVHCIAMCGGINLSQSLGRNDNNRFASTLSYNLGRILSYSLIGFVMGGIGYLIGSGTEVGISTTMQGMLKVIAGIFTIIMAINMLDIFPWFKKINISVPKPIARFVIEKRAKTKLPLLVGFLNGFMPCGPLQSMWIVALASANPVEGSLSMFFFALGTLPLMMGLGSLVAWLGDKYTKVMMKAGGIVVAVLGIALISQGIALSGMKVNYTVAQSAEVETPDSSTESDGDVQLIESTLELGTYPNITVEANVPVRWIINVPEGTLTGCNRQMIIPEYGIQYAFDYGENVIEFTPTETGQFTYTCWMGMITGNIAVV